MKQKNHHCSAQIVSCNSTHHPTTHPPGANSVPVIVKLMLILTILSMSGCKIGYRKVEGTVDRTDMPVEISHVKGGLYVVEDYNYWKTNVVFYATKKGAFFIDATYLPKSATRIIWKGAAYSMAEFLGVLVTSYPLYHSGGISAFRNERIPVYTNVQTATLLDEKWEKMQDEMDRSYSTWLRTENVYVTQYIGDEANFYEGKIQVKYPGDGHTPGNLIVYFPEEKALYAGSILSDPLMFTRESRRSEYLKVLNECKKLKPEIVIAGHGEAMQDPEFIDHVMDLVREDPYMRD